MLRPLLIAALLLIGLTVLGRSGGGGGPAPAASHLHARSHPSRFGGSVDTEAILQRWTAHHDSHLRRRSFNWFGLKKRDPEEERVIRLREAYAQRATEFMRMVLETNHGPGAPVPRKHIAKRQGSGNPVASMIASKATTAATNTNTATGLVTITAATKTSTSTLSAIPTDPPLSLPPGTFRNDYKDSYIYNPNTIRDPTWPLVPYASWNLTDALQRNYTCEINAPIEDFENREAFEVDSKNKVGGMNGGSGMLLSYVNGTTSFQGKLTDELGSSADVRGYFVRQLNYGNIQIDPTSKGVWLIYDEKAGNNMSNDSYANFVAWTSQLVWINLDQGRFDSITQNGSIVPYSSMDQTQFNHTTLPINNTHALMVGTLQDMRTLNSTPHAFKAPVKLNATFDKDGMFYFVPKNSSSWWSTAFPRCQKADRYGFLEFDLMGPPTSFGVGVKTCNGTSNASTSTLWITVDHTDFHQHHSIPMGAVLAANMPPNSILVCSPLDLNLATLMAGPAVVNPTTSTEWGPILANYSFVDTNAMLQRPPLFINPALMPNPQLMFAQKAFGNCSIFTPPATSPAKPINSTSGIDFSPWAHSIGSILAFNFTGFQSTKDGQFFYALDNITLTTAQTCKPSCNAQGRFHYGVSINWWDDDPLKYIDRVGDRVRPTFWSMYTYIDRDENGLPFFSSWNVIGAADRLIQLKYGPVMLGVVVMPNGGLETVTDDVVADVARVCKIVNDKGVYVMLIFGHEANGWWYPYGAKPTAYKEAWTRLTKAVRAVAPFTRTVWPMNEAHTYPFGNTNYDPVLDTNNNGQLDPGDDPYTPYYAGDAVHDWVGLSLYHLGNFFPWGDVNEVALPNKVVDIIEGAKGYDWTAETATNFDFYKMFAVKHGKQMAITETSATYYPDVQGASRREVQRSWWQQVYDSQMHLNKFPMLRMINWFEWAKTEDNQWKDWKLTDDPATVDQLVNDLPHELVVKDYELVENCFF